MYREGTRVSFNYEHDGVIEKGHEFILAECHEQGFVFQLICIRGYHAGKLEGYIKPEPNTNGSKISEDHLVKELNRNFIEIHWDSFKVLN